MCFSPVGPRFATPFQKTPFHGRRVVLHLRSGASAFAARAQSCRRRRACHTSRCRAARAELRRPVSTRGSCSGKAHNCVAADTYVWASHLNSWSRLGERSEFAGAAAAGPRPPRSVLPTAVAPAPARRRRRAAARSAAAVAAPGGATALPSLRPSASLVNSRARPTARTAARRARRRTAHGLRPRPAAARSRRARRRACRAAAPPRALGAARAARRRAGAGGTTGVGG